MPTVTYTPRSKGFAVKLEVDALTASIEAVSPDDAAPVVTGDADLTENPALMARLSEFAINENAQRRLRAAEKRKSHMRAAEAARDDVVALSKMIEARGSALRTARCSSCFGATEHVVVKGWVRPQRYLCRACGSPTVPCAVPTCKHHGTYPPRARITVRYCAEHQHQIPGFDKLDATIESLDEVEDFLSYETFNAARASKVSVGVLGGTIILAPIALVAAPAVGAALGGSVLGGSLTGAAATSHGLAMLGGGAVAAGGLGMMGGTAVVTATGAALGGALGATTASAYAAADSSFRIERLRGGTGSPVVFATGFLTEGQSGWKHWRRLIDQRYPDAPVYQLHWGAKEIADLAALVAGSGMKAAGHALFVAAARRGSKAFLRVPYIAALFAAQGLATNPWLVARTRADMTGAALAPLLARSTDGPFVLMGHSLGARVMVKAAQALGTAGGGPRLESLHLLGAAVGRGQDWRNLDRSVSEAVYNYWSSRDAVLKLAYSSAQLGERAVGQAGFRSRFPAIKDRNVSKHVPGHSDYLAAVKLVAPPRS